MVLGMEEIKKAGARHSREGKSRKNIPAQELGTVRRAGAPRPSDQAQRWKLDALQACVSQVEREDNTDFPSLPSPFSLPTQSPTTVGSTDSGPVPRVMGQRRGAKEGS